MMPWKEKLKCRKVKSVLRYHVRNVTECSFCFWNENYLKSHPKHPPASSNLPFEEYIWPNFRNMCLNKLWNFSLLSVTNHCSIYLKVLVVPKRNLHRKWWRWRMITKYCWWWWLVDDQDVSHSQDSSGTSISKSIYDR